jgi:hypothetical protein
MTAREAIDLVMRHLQRRIPEFAGRTDLELDLCTRDAELEIEERLEIALGGAFEDGWRQRGFAKEDDVL